MQPEPGLMGPAGWERSTAGAPNCRWSCAACGKAAGNSSRLFEILRTPCGERGEWRQLKHEATIFNGKMQCSRCGTERQQCVQLGLQSCPVRVRYRANVEQPAATAVYAAWHTCVRAMHSWCRAGGGRAAAGEAAADQAPVNVAAAGEADVQVLVPQACQLRPLRSHICVRTGEAEFCIACFCRAPRFRVAAWRQGCCDGAAPVGSCPKHILAAVSLCRVSWPPRFEGRGANIEAAAKTWCGSHALRSLRPPKRRVAARAA